MATKKKAKVVKKKVAKKPVKKVAKKKVVAKKPAPRKKAPVKKVKPATVAAPPPLVEETPIMVEEITETFVTPDGTLEVTETILTFEEEPEADNGFAEDDLADADEEKDEEGSVM